MLRLYIAAGIKVGDSPRHLQSPVVGARRKRKGIVGPVHEFRFLVPEAAAVGEICFKEFAEIVDALILTKVVTVQREEIDIPYWIKETAREIAGLAIWATENELSVLQDIALKMKERAGK